MKRLKQKERFTIENPKAIDSLNMCLSGQRIEIIYLTETFDWYVYKLQNTLDSASYLFKINRYKRDDKNVDLLVSDYTGGLTKSFLVSYRKLLNKNEFQNWLVKRVEEKFNFI